MIHKYKIVAFSVLAITLCILLFVRTKLQENQNEQSASQPYNQSDVENWAVLKLKQIAPSVGFETQLSPLPRLTWHDIAIYKKTGTDTIDVHYPIFDDGTTTMALDIYISDFITHALGNAVIGATESMFAPDQGLDITISYRVVDVVHNIVSMEIITTDYSMSGNGNHNEVQTINWDLRQDRLLQPSELFCTKSYIDRLIPIARKKLVDLFNNDPHISVRPISQDMIDTINYGTENNPSNWQHFLITDGGLILVFPTYQVSSGAAGIVRILVPSTEIPGLLCL